MKYDQHSENLNITYQRSEWIISISGADTVYEGENMPDAIMVVANVGTGTRLNIKLRDNDSFVYPYFLRGVIYPCKFKALIVGSGSTAGSILGLWH